MYYVKASKKHMIGKCTITFENDDIILNGKKLKCKYKLTYISSVFNNLYYSPDNSVSVRIREVVLYIDIDGAEEVYTSVVWS